MVQSIPIKGTQAESKRSWCKAEEGCHPTRDRGQSAERQHAARPYSPYALDFLVKKAIITASQFEAALKCAYLYHRYLRAIGAPRSQSLFPIYFGYIRVKKYENSLTSLRGHEQKRWMRIEKNLINQLGCAGARLVLDCILRNTLPRTNRAHKGSRASFIKELRQGFLVLEGLVEEKF